jgi:hypothetical protein
MFHVVLRCESRFTEHASPSIPSADPGLFQLARWKTALKADNLLGVCGVAMASGSSVCW